MKHGTVSTYNNLDCRCADCKKANREYTRVYLAARYANGRGLGKVCRFGGCDREAILDYRGFCYPHGSLTQRLVKAGKRTREEIELACKPT